MLPPLALMAVALTLAVNRGVVRADMDEKLAYAVVKTMFDKQADLIAVHKEAASLKLATQSNANTPIPFHPGAIKYYAEKGMTVK